MPPPSPAKRAPNPGGKWSFEEGPWKYLKKRFCRFLKKHAKKTFPGNCLKIAGALAMRCAHHITAVRGSQHRGSQHRGGRKRRPLFRLRGKMFHSHPLTYWLWHTAITPRMPCEFIHMQENKVHLFCSHHSLHTYCFIFNLCLGPVSYQHPKNCSLWL